MVTHKAAFVYITAYTHYASMTRILPHGNIASIGQFRLLVGIHGYHEFIIVYLAHQMAVIEITEGIYQRGLMVGLLNQIEEGMQRIAELFRR